MGARDRRSGREGERKAGGGRGSCAEEVTERAKTAGFGRPPRSCLSHASGNDAAYIIPAGRDGQELTLSLPLSRSLSLSPAIFLFSLPTAATVSG